MAVHTVLLRYKKSLVVASVFLLFILYLRISDFHPNTIQHPHTNKSTPENLIETPRCTLPKTGLFPKKFKLSKNFKPNCSYEKTLVDIDDISETLQIRPEFLKSIESNDSGAKTNGNETSCTVLEIQSGHPKNDNYRYGEEIKVTGTSPIDISGKELLVTKCGPNINFNAHFPLTKSVLDKISHWKTAEEVLMKEPPISVLFMGFDTMSRSHFHRSFERALPLMKEKLGFIDFQGYHSVAPYTLENFLSFLVGMTAPTLRSSCASSWSVPFDKCPLIWKNFDYNKYVTMYIEDGSQTFNWGGMSGFKAKRPTDYYPHPLFLSIQPIRTKYNYKNETHDGPCLSTLNPQNFILNYTKRFLTKFMNLPFFSFIWFASPFHESMASLPAFDNNFTGFMEFLNSHAAKTLRERTLVIVNADHGNRYGSFIKNTGYESFIERSLPGLFIRLPDNLVARFPEKKLRETLETNSKRLTSGFDIHHTFLHLLEMQGLGNPFQETTHFEPVLNDRSSLFLPVTDQRNCTDINVLPGNCVCNTSSNASTIDNPFFTQLLVDFAFGELNAIINGSVYKDMCALHHKPMLSFLSADVLQDSPDYTDAMVRIITDRARANFEVQLRLHYKNQDKSQFDHIERRSQFSRINAYGDLSWCVGFETDFDKKMKELCHCKEKKKS